MSEHTPTPWRNHCFQILGADNSKIAHTGMGNLPPSRSSESEANAVFIVKAVNNHDALVRALEEILSAEKDFREGLPADWEGDPLTDACATAREVLAKATEDQA